MILFVESPEWMDGEICLRLPLFNYFICTKILLPFSSLPFNL